MQAHARDHRPTAVRRHRWGLLRRCVGLAALVALGACGGPGAQRVTQADADGQVASAEDAVEAARAQLEAGDRAAAWAALSRGLALGARGLDVDALVVVLAPRPGEQARATAATGRLLAATAGDDAQRAARAGQLLDRATEAQLQTDAATDALRLSEARWPHGCPSARACTLAARVLIAVLAVPDLQPPDAAWRSVHGLAPADAALRGPWLHALARDAAAARRLGLAGVVLERLRATAPADPQTWATAWVVARRTPGGNHRASWLRDIGKAGLARQVIVALSRQPEVSTDALARAGLLEQLALRKDATPADWAAWAGALADATDDGRLRGLVANDMARFATIESRAALALALLRVGETGAATPIIEGLKRVEPGAAQTLAVLAEWHRRSNRPDEARAAATAAIAADADPSRRAWQIARSWSVDARAMAVTLLRESAHLPGSRQLEVLWGFADELFSGPRPMGDAALLARRLARLIAERGRPDDKVPASLAQRTVETLGGDHIALTQVRDELVDRLTKRRRSAWGDVALGVLETLASSPVADARTLLAFTRLHLEGGRPHEAVAVYRRAVAMAKRSTGALDGQDMVAALVRAGDGVLLARWMRAAGIDDVADEGLRWQAAELLLESPARSLGRQLTRRALAAAAAAARQGDPADGASARRMEIARWKRLAASGAADLLLAAIDTPAWPGRENTADVLAKALIRAKALVRVGRGRDAGRVLVDVANTPGLSAVHRLEIAEQAAGDSLCAAVMLTSDALAASHPRHKSRQMLDTVLSCGRRLGDREAIVRFVDAVRRSNTGWDRHLHLAEKLVEHGFAVLAPPIFAEALAGKRGLNERQLMAYAESLLVLGRVRKATPLLERSIAIQRGRTRGVVRAVSLLERYAAWDAARLLLDRALESRPTDTDLRLRLVRNRLMAGDRTALAAHVPALLRDGASEAQLDTLLGASAVGHALEELHRVLVGLPDLDRVGLRFRLEVAGHLGDRREVERTIVRLRSKAQLHAPEAVEALVRVGAERQARAVAQEILASGEQLGKRRGRTSLQHYSDRARAFDAALAARRDPGSPDEARQLARLYAGRARDKADAASEAAVVLAENGLMREARALGRRALELAPDDPLELCLQGHYAWQAGDKPAARRAWRRSMAALLLDERLERDIPMREDRPAGRPVRCLRNHLLRAGAADLGAEMVREWLEVRPRSAWLWNWLVSFEVMRGRTDLAIEALAEAARRLPRPSAPPRDAGFAQSEFAGPARTIVAAGGGPALVAWMRSDPAARRTEGWWVAFVLQTVLAHVPEHERGAADVQALLALADEAAATDPQARLAVAAVLNEQGQTERARAVLGADPFAVDAGLRAASYGFRRTRGSDGSTTSPPVDDVLDTRVASVAGSVLGSIAAGAGAAPGRSEAGQSAVAAPLEAWLAGAGEAGRLELAATFARLGHRELTAQLLGTLTKRSGALVHPETAELALQAALQAGDDATVVRAARRTLLGAHDRHAEVVDRIWRAATAGRLQAARSLAKTLRSDTPGRLLPPIFLPERDELRPAERAVELFDREALVEAARDLGSLRLPELRGLLEAAVVMRAADEAQAIARAIASQLDEPWRVWLRLSRLGLRHQDLPLAQRAFKQASRLHPPGGVTACLALGVGVSTDIPACERGRPFATIASDELGDLAVAIAGGMEPAAYERLLARASHVSVRELARWVGGMAARFWQLDDPGKDRMRRFVAGLISRIEPVEQQRLAVRVALDDLSAIGMSRLGIHEMQRQLRALPGSALHRNNLVYARLLDGEAAGPLVEEAIEIWHERGDESAHALLDTLAVGLQRAERTDDALRVQRLALGSLVPSDQPVIPTIRYAEMLLAAGRVEDAHAMAVVAGHHLGDRDEPGTRARVDAVLRAVARTPRPATAPPADPAATGAPDKPSGPGPAVPAPRR